MSSEESVIIVGGGPCGLSAAIELQKKGYSPLVIEKGNIVQSIFRYPTHQTFFSSSHKLEIGEMPFVIEGHKPRRNQALSYYREVAKRKDIRINTFEKVERVQKNHNQSFAIHTTKKNGESHEYQCSHVIIATGYYDNPNYMGIPGEDKEKVFHYFKEAHPFFNTDVVVIGGKNSAVDTSMELEKVGARVTVIYRSSTYSKSVKPWILPEFESLVNKGYVKMEFDADVREIKDESIIYEQNGQTYEIKNDYVFAMTGYHPDHHFLTEMGINIDTDSGRPNFNPDTMETNIEGIFIAGVIAAGNNANEIFIENGRFHGKQIAEIIAARDK